MDFQPLINKMTVSEFMSGLNTNRNYVQNEMFERIHP